MMVAPLIVIPVEAGSIPALYQDIEGYFSSAFWLENVNIMITIDKREQEGLAYSYTNLDAAFLSVSNEWFITQINPYEPIIFIDTANDGVLTYDNNSNVIDTLIWEFKTSSVSWLKANIHNYSEPYNSIYYNPCGIESFSYTDMVEISYNHFVWTLTRKYVYAQKYINGTANWNVNVTLDTKYDFHFIFTENATMGVSSIKIDYTAENLQVHPNLLNLIPDPYTIDNISLAQKYHYGIRHYVPGGPLFGVYLNLFEICEEDNVLLKQGTASANSTIIKSYGTTITDIEYGSTYLWNDTETRQVNVSQTRNFYDPSGTPTTKFIFHNFIEFGGCNIKQDPIFNLYYNPYSIIPLIIVCVFIGIFSLTTVVLFRRQKKEDVSDE